MADHTGGDGVVGSSSNLQTINSGDSELDEKIAEWLRLDKVTCSFPNTKYASPLCYCRKYSSYTCDRVSDHFSSLEN